MQKLVLELDHQRAYTKQQLLETHEKGNSLLKHHKDQYTMSLVRDLRIEQVWIKIILNDTYYYFGMSTLIYNIMSNCESRLHDDKYKLVHI